MKKSLLSKILLLCLIFSLTATLIACGGANSSAPEPAPAEEEEPAESSVEEEPEVAEEPAEPEEEITEDEPSASEEEAPEESLVPAELLGTVTDGSYVNEYFGLRYDAPENWYVLSREELAVILGIATANLDDAELIKMFESDGYVTDLYVMEMTPAIEGAEVYSSVNMTIQDIGKLYGMLFDEKQLAEASAKSTRESLEALGMTDIAMEVGEAEFLGKPCVSTSISGKSGDYDIYQKQVYLKNGSAVACVTATTPGEDQTDEVLSVFRGSAEAEAAPASADADAGALAEASLSSGAIAVDGDLFALGMNFRDIKGGWTLKAEDLEKYKEYSLNPRTTSGTAMGVYKEEWGYEFTSFHVMVSLFNGSESPVPYLEGDVDYISVPGIGRVDYLPAIVFPGGLTLESSEEEFIAAYGEPAHVYEDESTEFKSLTFEEGDVRLQITWTKGEINEITLTD